MERERRVNFHSMGGYLGNSTDGYSYIQYTHTSRHGHQQTQISPPWLEHILVLNFSVAWGTEGSLKFPIKMPVCLFQTKSKPCCLLGHKLPPSFRVISLLIIVV